MWKYIDFINYIKIGVIHLHGLFFILMGQTQTCSDSSSEFSFGDKTQGSEGQSSWSQQRVWRLMFGRVFPNLVRSSGNFAMFARFEIF